MANSKRMISETAAKSPSNGALPRVFGACSALLLSVAFLKLGTPSVMEDRIGAPQNFAEILFNAWPASIGLMGLAALALLGWVVLFDESTLRERATIPRWIVWLPLVWAGWQFVAALDTVSPKLTRPTLFHFTATTACFYLGFMALGRLRSLAGFGLLFLGGYALMILVGLEQHFWGLEQTREYFYSQPALVEAFKRENPDFLVKLESNRIWGTLFYPNAFAGGIILLLPAAIAFVWKLTEDKVETSARWVMVSLVVVPSLACLYWTGSKTGILLALVQGALALSRLRIPTRLKLTAGGLILTIGLIGFFLVFADYFKKGARSLGARADYWRAAVAMFKENPVNGVGPGAFMVPYENMKAEESEMARLAHNDYIQQASDSGIVGFLAFAVFVAGSITLLYRKSLQDGTWEFFLIWLGLAGWSLQIAMEFSLYIPGLAWPAFMLMGLLWGWPDRPKPVDKPNTAD